jgi:hypothetical protein
VNKIYTTLFVYCHLTMPCGLAFAATGSNYTSPINTFSSSGGTAKSANYSDEATVGEIGGNSTDLSSSVSLKSGFIGQLYEAQSLVLAADPSAVIEETTAQLSGVATMDDGTLVRLAGSDAKWSVVDGAITGISSGGLATAGLVFINAPATVRGRWDGVTGDLVLSVLNLNVTPPGNAVPDPVFTPQVFAANQIGIYQGLLKDSGGDVVGALLGFKLLSTRAFSGKVVLNGITYSLSGQVQADGSFSGQILRRNQSPIAVTLQLGTTAAGGLTLQGSVVGDGTTGNGFIAQAPFTKANPAPSALVKSYTFLVPAPSTGDDHLPEGDGYGSAKVSTLGVITAAGKTGDGVAFTTTGYLTADRQWHLFQFLYQSKGQLAGVLSFRDVPGISDVDGALRWAKNPNPLNKSYPDGFELAPGLVGSLYTAPTEGQRVLTQLADQHYNAQLTLAGTVMPGSGLAKTVSWLNTNSLAYYGPESLAAKMTGTTGILSGSYYDPVTQLKVPFAGAVLQKQGMASGNFLVSNRAGYVFIEPGTGFPYPGSEGAVVMARLTLPSSPAVPPILTPALFSSGVAGSYGGILENGPAISGGLESVVISKTGSLSGTVVIEGKRHKFTGVIGGAGLALVEIRRTGLPSIMGSLQLALANGTVDGLQLTGTFNGDGITHAIDAQRFPVFTKSSPAPQTGKYTVAMAAPESADVMLEPGGDGYASLTVAYTGATTGTLILADGTATTFAGRLSRNGEWSLHRGLYGSMGGYLAGKLSFRDVPGISDVDGQWRWVKPNAVPRTPTYSAGFKVTRDIVGSRYNPLLVGQRAWSSLTDTGYNAWLRLSGPDLSTLPLLTLTAVDRAVTWSTANRIIYYGPDKAAVSFSATTGIATGSYSDTSRQVSVKFGGALLQKQGLLTGRYGAGNVSGRFWMEGR